MDRTKDTGGTGELPAEPIPPRFRWLKRLLVCGGILLVALLCVRWWWGWEAHRRLQAEIDKYLAGGEPIYPEDFDSEPVPNDQNAAKLLLDAEAALNLTPEQTELISKLAGKPDEVQNHLDELRSIVAANAKTLDLVHQARSLPGVDWGVRIRSPAVNFLLPSLSGQRSLSKLLSATARYQHAIGDDGAAVETLHDTLAQAEAVDAQPILISHLVAIAIKALVARGIEPIAPALTVQTSRDNKDQTKQPARRFQVQSLITALLDEESFRNAHVRAMWSERMWQLDMVQLFIRGDTGWSAFASFGAIAPAPLWERAIAYPFIPLFKLDGLWMVRHTTALADAAGKPNWPAAAAALPPEPVDWPPFDKLTHPFSRIILRSLSRAVLLHYRTLALSRMGAIALAIRLYEVDHGHRPEKLEDLVPDYLPHVPLDAFAEDDRTIGYKPDVTPPVLYSIGPDGVDNDGVYFLRPDGGIHYDKLDMPFFLNREDPKPDDKTETEAPASTETDKKDQDVQDQERDPEKDQSREDEP